MATIRELQKKIDLLDKGLKSKATKPALKIKMRKQVSELKKEIKVLERASSRGLNSVEKAKLLAKKRRSKQTNQSTNDSDIESDAKRYAINKTKRVSKGGRANQYGTKAENKGGIYYESRENRYDRQNKRYAKLEDGGSIDDKNKKIMIGYREEISDLRRQSYPKMSISEARKIASEYMLFNYSKEELLEAIKSDKQIEDMGTQNSWINALNKAKKRKMADGGMFAKGGQVSGYFTFQTYEKQGNYLISTQLKGVSPDDVMRKGVQGKLKGNDINSAEEIAHVIMQEHPYVAKLDIVKQGASVLKNKKVATFIRDEESGEYQIQYFADGGMMAKGGEKKYAIVVENTDRILIKDTDKSFIDKKYKELKEVYDKKYPNDKISIVEFADGGTTDIGGTEFSTEDLSGMFAKGGMTEHGLKHGDKITGQFDNIVVVENDGKTFVVNLNVGKRWSENQWYSMNHGQSSKNSKMANGGETHRREDGMYAKGGETSKYKHKIILEIDKNNDSVYEGGEKFDVAIFTSKGDALMCVRALQEKAPKYYHYRLISN
jgi:hypothetical protein